jgi:hypothetical protein
MSAFDARGRALRDRLLTLFRGPVDRPLADAAFDRLARSIFRYQFETNPPYAAWCRRRGATPASVSHWTHIPAVPTAAFREIELKSGGAQGTAGVVFRTSGTTGGGTRRGTHHVPDPSLYHASLLAAFAAWVLPDGARPTMLSLLPHASAVPDSSLAHMLTVVIERLGGPGSGWHATAQDGIDEDGLRQALREAEADGRPVCLLGTSFSFVHWTDALAARDERFQLPAGSRLVDTGGFKGRSREVEPEALRATCAKRFGLADHTCVNEYGMTEMCSQFYDAALRDATLGRLDAAPRRKVGPPWVRTVIVDPDTLAPVPSGEPGLLRHVDLANLGSVIAVQTEDLGIASGDGFTLLGRAAGAPPRGCSIAVDELLSAATRHRAC